MGEVCLFYVTSITYFIYIRVDLRQSGLTIMGSMKNLELN